MKDSDFHSIHSLRIELDSLFRKYNLKLYSPLKMEIVGAILKEVDSEVGIIQFTKKELPKFKIELEVIQITEPDESWRRS